MADDRRTSIDGDQITDNTITPEELLTSNVASEEGVIIFENGQMKWIESNATSANSNKVAFFDDFLTQELSHQWNTARSGSGSLVQITNAHSGQVLLRAGNGNGRWAELYFGQYAYSSLSLNPRVITRLKVNNIINSQYYIELNWTDSDNHVILNASYGANWFLRTKASGIETSVNTGIALNTNWNLFDIRGSSSSVTAYINNVLVATSTTNIPTGIGDISLYIYATGTGGNKDMYVDTFRYSANRGNS